MDAAVSSAMWNIYYSTSPAGWYYRNTGPGFALRSDGSNVIQLYYAANATGGSAASPGIAWTVLANNGNFGISNAAPSDKLSINGTTYLGGAVSSAINLTANTTGVYHTGIVNAATFSVGTSVTVNSSLISFPLGNVTSTTFNLASGTSFFPQLTITNYTSDVYGPYWNTQKSRANGAVVSGDTLGTFIFRGHDGTQYINSSYITSQVDGTVATNVIPTKMHFYTANATGNLNSVLFLSGNGNIGLSNTAPTHKLSVNGTGYFGANLTIDATADLVLPAGAGISANGSLGTSGQVLASNGTATYWSTVSGGASLTANNTNTQTFYFPMANTISGSWSNGVVANTKLYFVPSTGTLSATVFNSLSDKTQKTNIQTIINPLDKISELRGVSFNWKETNEPSIGVIAQEVEKVLPELVTEKHGVKSVNYDGLIGVLIESIKELKQEIQDLKSQK